MTKGETVTQIPSYHRWLYQQGLAKNTITKYTADIFKMLAFNEEIDLKEAGEKKNRKHNNKPHRSLYEKRLKTGQVRESDEVDQDYMRSYREYLQKSHGPASANSYLISANRFFQWAGHEDYKMKTMRLQRKNSVENIITREEYDRLLKAADNANNSKFYHIMKTLGLTGIRIGELAYVTVEAVYKGEAWVNNKGKSRIIYLPPKLCKLLKRYCKKNHIREGVIFWGRTRGEAITPSAVWKGLKKLAEAAEVAGEKVYPHSFRHLFAKEFMKQCSDITELASILGHSSLEVTWIYTQTSAQEKRNMMNRTPL